MSNETFLDRINHIKNHLTPTFLHKVVIVSYGRSPIGGFQGSLSSLSAVEIAAQTIKGVLDKCKLSPDLIDEVILGNVISGAIGQAPAKQAALKAGLPTSVPCTVVNKVCASGMKATMIGTQLIQTGAANVVLVGGMESMSNVPYYLNSKARTGGLRLGNSELVDGLMKDGLTDPFGGYPMGVAAEKCSVSEGISKDQQDQYALSSYERSIASHQNQLFSNEIIPIETTNSKKQKITVTVDEEINNVNYKKLAGLKSVFQKEGGCVTAGNSSTLSDGASILILMSEQRAKELQMPIIAYIRGMADASQEPILFPTTPALAIPKSLATAGISLDQVDFFEINEAFAVVALANMKRLQIPISKINMFGGSVSLGHPLGSSGSRILCTLISVLKHNKASIGVASICNGGGGASSIVIELHKE
ncbi:acetyl-CoA C-acetyltransferase [Tieghemostelium lacteum]|uniref:acetyl-CoA C-acetyltransferase n=1 Tax=Tieghemostelium lacteum TaxID=361077 RepID=A0A152A212_TIELA|nr:acetyl-CoA C-acetyltransferase [Tieghemostelium lacteum]|eukprot:KYR00157.1 acetyl-CoA C-acetyltransferase [Tieghemostelium lacteum]